MALFTPQLCFSSPVAGLGWPHREGVSRHLGTTSTLAAWRDAHANSKRSAAAASSFLLTSEASSASCNLRTWRYQVAQLKAASLLSLPYGTQVLNRRQATGRNHQAGRRSAGSTRCAAAGDDGRKVYNGMYGPWSVEESDRREVLAYRAGLVTAAATFVIGASYAFLPASSPVHAALAAALDPLYAAGAGALGLSLVLIHIYVTPIKRFLQLLWAAGAVGSLGVAVGLAGEQGLVAYVVEHRGAVWAVGPLFAALTGLVFKEGLCYGKLEAAVLVFIIPSLLLGHLSGAMPSDTEAVLLAAWAALFSLFAARKFAQPIKDDIGDKSVFEFMAKSPAEQEALIARLRGAAPAGEGEDHPPL